MKRYRAWEKRAWGTLEGIFVRKKYSRTRQKSVFFMSLMNAISILSLLSSLNHVHHVGFNKNNPCGIISFTYSEIKNSQNLTKRRNDNEKEISKKFNIQEKKIKIIPSFWIRISVKYKIIKIHPRFIPCQRRNGKHHEYGYSCVAETYVRDF